MTANKIAHFVKSVARAVLLVAVVAAPLLVVQKVNAGTDTVIGETQTMSNGVGLVLVMGLRRS